MSALRSRMESDMVLRGMSARTVLGVSPPLRVEPESVQAFWLRVAALDITVCPIRRIGHLHVVGAIRACSLYVLST